MVEDKKKKNKIKQKFSISKDGLIFRDPWNVIETSFNDLNNNSKC